MLAHKYTNENPVGKYLSEKLDGYRAFFYKSSSTTAEFFSRNLKPFIAPDWYLEDIAKHVPVGTLLDGELYTQRGDFEGMGVVRKKIPVDAEWKKIRYMVFDMPLVEKPFEERYEIMRSLLKSIPHIHVVKQYKIKSEKQFQDLHKQWVSEGAEGSMLRDPFTYYEQKRTKNLLKVKDFLDDEAIVEGVQMGEGRNSHVMGNLIVRWAPQAKQKYKGTFDVGSGFTDEQRKHWKTLFKPGTVITIRYFEIQKSGKPRFPTFQNIYHKV
jgi:DNA ligase-1